MQHLCAKDFLVQGRTDLRFEYSAAGRGVSSLVGSAWRPTSVLGELTDKAVNSSLTFFLFHRARRIFFLMSQKENAGCIPTVKPCILVPQSGTMLHPCGGSPRPLLEQRKSRRHSNGQSPFGSSIPHGITMLPRAATPRSFVKQGTYRGHLHGKAVLLSNLSGKNTTFLWIK